jgi:hypothetical protein
MIGTIFGSNFKTIPRDIAFLLTPARLFVLSFAGSRQLSLAGFLYIGTGFGLFEGLDGLCPCSRAFWTG